MSRVQEETSIALAERLLHLVKTGLPVASEVTDSSPAPDNQTVYNTKIKIQEVCNELLRSVLGPSEYTGLLAEAFQESAALHLVTSLGVPDVIGDGTASLSELCEKTGAGIQYLKVAMGCLLALGYFEEVGGFGTRLYKNNSFSDVLREKHPETLKDAVGFVCDEGMKGSSYILEAAKTPAEQQSQVAAVNLAYGYDQTIFDWMASPEQAWRAKRLGKAMQQLHHVVNNNMYEDFPWNKLGSPIVDVGGGIGSLAMALLTDERNKDLSFIVFDLPKTIDAAQKVWNDTSPALLPHVSFVPGDFLATTLAETRIPLSQPTYFIRHVLHNWTDAQVVAILRNVRAAMLESPPADTVPKLLVCEMLLRASAPRFVRMTSMQLLALNNGVTRSEAEVAGLIEHAGFRVEKVYEMRAACSIIEARPI